MDSDLAESISALKEAFERRDIRAKFGSAPAELVTELRAKLRVPRRYREFLAACDPLDVESRTPTERVRLIKAADLAGEQAGFSLDAQGELIGGPTAAGWRPGWVIIGRSTLLGDPYFLDTGSPDAEGDCPVYTAMNGTDVWKPRLCASNFAAFLRILAVAMDVAAGFADDDIDMDDEQVFRDTLGPKIRPVDPAALKAGHWT
ncbi:MAG: SMI1/KNR4 family protein [Sorangiineae bacterium]|nr:SMI1/KNR4 family protein [Polyangiaceae bacterium]MEB2320908.1 SMI1/KNR4 family protein [Sorangiineae bacterium]